MILTVVLISQKADSVLLDVAFSLGETVHHSVILRLDE